MDHRCELGRRVVLRSIAGCRLPLVVVDVVGGGGGGLANSTPARLPQGRQAHRRERTDGKRDGWSNHRGGSGGLLLFVRRSGNEMRDRNGKKEGERGRERESGGGLSVATASACWRYELTKFCAFESSPRRLLWTESKGGWTEGGREAGTDRQEGREA